MFQCDAVDTSPDLGGKMSSKPSKWLFHIKRRTTWTEFERVLSLDIFSLTFKTYSPGHLMGGDRPHGSVTDWVSVRASRIHADNIWLLSRLRIFDFVVHYGKQAFTRTSCPSMNKSAVQSRSASDTSPLLPPKLFAIKMSLFPHETVSLHITQFHLLWRWLLLKPQHFSKWDQQKS